MVSFKDGKEDILCVVAGFGGPTPSHRQPGARYEYGLCNEHHMFSLSTSEWYTVLNDIVCYLNCILIISCNSFVVLLNGSEKWCLPPAGKWSTPVVTGQPPPPCSMFTLTLVSEKRAALFGGSISGYNSDNLQIVDLTKHTVVSVWVGLIHLLVTHIMYSLSYCVILTRLLLPALDQDQQTYQPLSGMAYKGVLSCCHMCEWSTTSDSGRDEWCVECHQWLLDSWPHYNEVEEGNLCYVSDTVCLVLVFSYHSLTLWLNDVTTHCLQHNYHHTMCC